jgi:hypothetical protein
MTEQALTREEVQERIIAKSWQDETFKQELLNNPKAVFSREVGQELPDTIELRVVEENPNTLYLVLPAKIDTNLDGELSESELEAVAGGIDWKKYIKSFVKTLKSGLLTCVG